MTSLNTDHIPTWSDIETLFFLETKKNIFGHFRNDFEIFHVSKVFLNLCFHYYDLWHSASIPVFLRHRIAFWRHTSPTKDGSITLAWARDAPSIQSAPLLHKKQDWKWSTDLIIVFRTWQNKCILGFCKPFWSCREVTIAPVLFVKKFFDFWCNFFFVSSKGGSKNSMIQALFSKFCLV